MAAVLFTAYYCQKESKIFDSYMMPGIEILLRPKSKKLTV